MAVAPDLLLQMNVEVKPRKCRRQEDGGNAATAQE